MSDYIIIVLVHTQHMYMYSSRKYTVSLHYNFQTQLQNMYVAQLYEVQKYRVASLYRTSYTAHIQDIVCQHNNLTHGATLSFLADRILVFFHSTAVRNLCIWLFVNAGHVKACGLRECQKISHQKCCFSGLEFAGKKNDGRKG